MFIIAGLGNPGRQYENTRHNVGFMAVDKIADKFSTTIDKVKFKGLICDTNYNGDKVFLLKPHTFMNLSGESVKDAVNFYKIPQGNLIVIYDDMDLPVGKIRIRPEGSSGGHNGIKSIIYQLSSEKFYRIRVGIGRPKVANTTGHVLGKFSDEEKDKIEQSLDAAAKAALTIIEYGINEAMNRFNNFEAK